MKNADSYTIRYQKFEENSKMALLEALPSEYEHFLNTKRLYVAHYGCVPCESSLFRIDCSAAAKWLAKHNRDEIVQEYRKRNYVGSPSMEEVVFCLKEDIMIHLNFNTNLITLLFNVINAKKVDELIKGFIKFQRELRIQPEMCILISSNGKLDTEWVPLKQYDIAIDSHYNDDFKEIHHLIMNRLNTKGEKGLVLLHGAPGTGKTTYLRHLIANLDKIVIFMTPSIAMELGEPALMGLLMENKDSIFVIEDAELLVGSRENRSYSPVSAMLNICDGLLSDFLNIQIICTFNTDISKIDTALLRKGRLIARYEFKALCAAKAQTLSNQLGRNTEIKQPLTLSEIYGQDEIAFEQLHRTAIGFNASKPS